MPELATDKKKLLEKLRGPSADPAPAPAKKKVTLQVEFGVDTSFLKDPHFRGKLLFLVALAVLFLFTAVMLQRSNLHLSDLFDAPRFSYHVTKLWSPAFLLFLVLYGVVLGLSAHYGYKLHWIPALFPLVLSLLLSLLLGLWIPSLSQAFLALALSVGAMALLTSRHEKPSPGNAWGASGWAVVVFVLLALVFVFGRVNANKDFYFDLMLSGATQAAGGAAPGAAPGGLSAQALTPLVSNAIQGINLNEAFYRSVIAKSDLQPLQAELSSTCAQTANVSLVSSGVCQNLLSQNYPIVSAAGGGVFVDPLYNRLIPLLVALSPVFKQRVSDQVTASLNASAAPTAAPGQPTPAPLVSSSTLRQSLLQSLPPLKIAYDYLAWMVALGVASILYSAAILSRLVAVLVAWGLAKLL